MSGIAFSSIIIVAALAAVCLCFEVVIELNR